MTSCTGGSSALRQARTSAGPGTSTTPATAATSPATPVTTASTPTSQSRLHVQLVATYHLGRSWMAGWSYSNGRIVAPFSPKRSDLTPDVALFDITTGKRSVVASSQLAGGTVSSVAIQGNWVVWVDSQFASPNPSVLWRVRALDLKTGERRLLATDGQAPNPFVPYLIAGGGYVVWPKTSAGGSVTRIVSWKPAWRAPRVGGVVESLVSAAVADGDLVYLGPPETGATAGTSFGDRWKVPLDGSIAPLEMTGSGKASACSADGSVLVWSDNHPSRIHTIDLTDGQTRVVYQGPVRDGMLWAGDQFAAWLTRSTIQIRSLTGSDHITIGPLSGLSYPGAAGDVVAYARTVNQRITFYVDEVTLSS